MVGSGKVKIEIDQRYALADAVAGAPRSRGAPDHRIVGDPAVARPKRRRARRGRCAARRCRRAASPASRGCSATRLMPARARARLRDRHRRRRLVGGRGAGALGGRAPDADRSRPCRRVEPEPPGARARLDAGRGQGRGDARAHRRHRARLPGATSSTTSSRRTTSATGAGRRDRHRRDRPGAREGRAGRAVRRARPARWSSAAAPAGGTDPLRLRRDDLSRTKGDALLASVRARLRREHGFPREATKRFRVEAIYSRRAPGRAARAAAARGRSRRRAVELRRLRFAGDRHRRDGAGCCLVGDRAGRRGGGGRING